ncbi:LysR family transcriptional regulator [Pandoraea capi]|uniref:LysR family transcriptional regulator n=2 Tax=Burkholderiaceae TaxID=119060 RepID=A0ABY6W4U8_9BURK|nr:MULTISPECIES: LysR family transcriptional regulator [Pandoraea]VVE26830.1 LysR family transcriptional regulator [Pandoraea capi]
MTRASTGTTRLDLNLIRVFVSIYETGSVTAAASRMFVTQPTVSYGLAKLREALHDPLFIRTADKMVPTAVGEATYRKFSSALVTIASAIEAPQQFDAQTSTRRFRLAMSDIGELIFLPPIYARVASAAPQVEIEIVQATIDEAAKWLAAGKVDLVIGNMQLAGEGIRRKGLFREHYECLLRKGHPAARPKLSLTRFVEARHVMVTSPFSGHSLVEHALRQHSVSRRIVMQILHFTILPQLLASSDLMATVPSRVGQYFEQLAPLRSVPLPIEIEPFEVGMYWHEFQDDNPAHAWMRDLVDDALSRI